MKISNKTIDYKLKASDPSGVMQLIDDSADVQLPSIEKTSDTTKGAGIMGEIDMPSYGQISSMTATVSFRADNSKYSMLSRPGPIKIEVVWTNDNLDSSNMSVGIQVNKVFMTGFNKKYDPGKIEKGGSVDGSAEFTVTYFRKLIDGKEVLLVDQLNNKYVVDGVDYMEKVRAALA